MRIGTAVLNARSTKRKVRRRTSMTHIPGNAFKRPQHGKDEALPGAFGEKDEVRLVDNTLARFKNNLLNEHGVDLGMRSNKRLSVILKESDAKPEDEDFVKVAWDECRLFHQDSGKKMKWDGILGIFIVYSVIIVPVRIGFDVTVEKGSGADLFDWFCDIMFFFDMCVNANTAYQDPNGFSIRDRKTILNKYLKSWFPIDFASTVPIDRIAEAIMGAGGDLRSLKMVRILRLIRLLKLLRLLKLDKVLNKLDVNPVFMKLAKLVLFMFFLAHFFACFWFFISFHLEDVGLPIDQRTETWLTHYLKQADEIQQKNIDDFNTRYIAPCTGLLPQ